MKLREQRTMLEEAGYALKRRGKKHELWARGHEMIPISTSTQSYHTRAAFLVKVRRAKKEQEMLTRQEYEKRQERESRAAQAEAAKNAPPPKEKEPLHLNTARAKILELVGQGKTHEEAAAILSHAFTVKSGLGLQITWDKMVETSKKPWGGTREKKPPKRAKAAAAAQPSPKKSEAEIEEKMKHVRAVIDMPFDKEKKIEIIIDLLDKIL